MNILLRIIRTVLAAEGLVISQRTLRSTRKLEIRREHGDQSVKNAVGLSPQSRLFQIPNALLASVYFASMTVLSITGAPDRKFFRPFTLVSAWISLGLSGYLLFQLWFVMKRNCPLCVRSHVVNLALTLSLTAKAVEPSRRRQ